MRLFAVVAMFLFSTLVFNAGTADKAYAQPSKKKASQTKKSKNLPKKITIKSGDTLSKIAKRYGSTYPRIFYANKSIKDPDVIYIGKKIRIPAPNEKLKKRPLHKPVQHTAPIVHRVQTQNQPQTTKQTPAPAPKPTYSNSNNGGVWDRIAQCESGGNWSINTGNGFYGGLQFTASSWHAAGGSGLPHQASKAEQIARAKVLQSRQGWGAWPACTSKLGIR